MLPDGTDTLLLVTNDGATEFRLARCPVPREVGPGPHSWAPARAERPDERLERVDGFAGHAVLSFRSETAAPAAGRCRSTPWTPTAS